MQRSWHWLIYKLKDKEMFEWKDLIWKPSGDLLPPVSMEENATFQDQRFYIFAERKRVSPSLENYWCGSRVTWQWVV